MPSHVITRGLVSLVAVSLSAQYVPTRTSRLTVSTTSGDIQITIDFYNKIEGDPLRFLGGDACIAFDGGECNRKDENFVGSFAIVHFATKRVAKLRERVKVIDQEEHMPEQPPFTKSVNVVNGVASDVQLFGHAKGNAGPDANALWLISRQELFLNDERTPFLVLHWRHSVERIILIDVIPGTGTTGLRRIE